MSPRGWLYVTIIGLILVVAGGVLGWVVFPLLVNLVIGKQLALKEHSDAWYRFVDLPLALNMELRIFNVTNPKEVYKGALPRFEELGPYVYKQYRTKHDLVVNSKDNTVSYYQRLIHVFDQDMSGTFKESDTVVVINPALMGMLGIMTNIPALSKATSFVDLAAPKLFGSDNVFLTTTAGDLLFRGVTIPCSKVASSNTDRAAAAMSLNSGQSINSESAKTLAALITCSSMKRINVPTITELPNGDLKFALFAYKNNTYDGRYTVNSGISDPKHLGQITAWNGKQFGTAWGAPTCNAVNGTQGDIFSPYVTKDTIIDVFSTDICRSMSVVYQEDSSYRGISAYRFSLSRDTLKDVNQVGNNYCFCPQVSKGLTKENGCLRNGALDLSGCQGVPVIITLPHFLDADPYFLERVEGLKPDPVKHRMVVDIEPMTGTPLQGGKKMQMNFQMREVDGVKLTAGLQNTLMPVAWLYEGVALDDEFIDLLNSLLFTNLKILDGIKYGMIALGALMFLGGSVQYLRLRGRPQPQKNSRKTKGSNRRKRLENGEFSSSSAATGETSFQGRDQLEKDVDGFSRYS